MKRKGNDMIASSYDRGESLLEMKGTSQYREKNIWKSPEQTCPGLIQAIWAEGKRKKKNMDNMDAG